jgi:hypothetical protein
MKDVARILGISLALWAFAAAFFHVAGCSQHQPQHVAAEAAYLLERQHCIDVTPKPQDDFQKRASWNFLDACWAGVDARFGVVSVATDGGAR